MSRYRKNSFRPQLVFLLYSLAVSCPAAGSADYEAELWKSLDPYQRTITRSEFLHLVETVFSPDGTLWRYIDLTPQAVKVFNAPDKTVDPIFTLQLAAGDAGKQQKPRQFARRPTLKDVRILAG